MPQINFSWLPHDSILTYEEILRICRILVTIGIKKIRLTGGEPLIRRDFIKLVEKLTDIKGLEEVCISTNGVLLKGYIIDDLYQAGVRHINISLDSLNPERFAYITGSDLFTEVWQGINKVMEAGFSPIKINSVIIRGINDNEIKTLAELSLKYPLHVRFIEFMPIGKNIFWDSRKFISSNEIKKLIEYFFGKLSPLPKTPNSGPASEYFLYGAPGSIGFIAPFSHNFCKSCNRLRITPDGRLRLCLFSDEEIDIKKALRSGINKEKLSLLFLQAALKKPKGWKFLNRKRLSCIRSMSRIGG
jgi:cyclic pyranopterin phosphate synthase